MRSPAPTSRSSSSRLEARPLVRKPRSSAPRWARSSRSTRPRRASSSGQAWRRKSPRSPGARAIRRREQLLQRGAGWIRGRVDHRAPPARIAIRRLPAPPPPRAAKKSGFSVAHPPPPLRFLWGMAPASTNGEGAGGFPPPPATAFGRWAGFAYGLASYLGFLAVFAYTIGFISDAGVPRTIDSPVSSTPATAIAIDVLLLLGFGAQHSVMARRGFKRVWMRLVPRPIERSTLRAGDLPRAGAPVLAVAARSTPSSGARPIRWCTSRCGRSSCAAPCWS